MTFFVTIADMLLSLALAAVLLRLLLQLTRADFRNQVAQAIVQITNPLIVPLRRIFPPIGKVDTASVIAVLLVAVLHVAVMSTLLGFGLQPAFFWLRAIAVVILRVTLQIYLYAILIYSLLSFIAQGNGRAPVQSLLYSLCEPVLRPFRRVIPPIAQIDLSPLWAGIIIVALLSVLH